MNIKVITVGMTRRGLTCNEEAEGTLRATNSTRGASTVAPKQSRTLEGKPAQASNSTPASNAKPKHTGKFDATDLPRYWRGATAYPWGSVCMLRGDIPHMFGLRDLDS